MAPVKRGPAVAGKHYKMGAAFSLCVLVSLCVLSQTENVKDYSAQSALFSKKRNVNCIEELKGGGSGRFHSLHVLLVLEPSDRSCSHV